MGISQILHECNKYPVIQFIYSVTYICILFIVSISKFIPAQPTMPMPYVTIKGKVELNTQAKSVTSEAK